MSIVNITFHQFVIFFIAFVRIATIISTVPVFGYNSVPIPVKVGLAFFISWVLFPVYEKGDYEIPVELLPFVLMAMKEVAVGLIIGIATQFLFTGVQMAGEIVGLDMGFGVVNILDPTTGDQVSIVSQFKYLLALLFFLAVNGHHFLLNALSSSFTAIPLGGAQFSRFISAEIVILSKQIFEIAIKIGGPAIVVLFLTSFVMGIVARMVPQMNIFIVGFPLKISLGFIMIWATVPLFALVFGKFLNSVEHSIVRIIGIM